MIHNNKLISFLNNPIIILIYSIILFFIADFFAYFWHRYISHSNLNIPILKNIQQSHLKHHTDENDNAIEDFMWIILLILIVSFAVLLLNFIFKLSIYYFVSTLLIGLLVFAINWYVHYSYHTENWLHQYEFFREKVKLHMRHHENINVNYGITTLYADYLMNSYDDKINEN